MGEARGEIVIDGFSTVKGSQPQCDLVSSFKSFCITSSRCNKRLYDCRCLNCAIVHFRLYDFYVVYGKSSNNTSSEFYVTIG